MNSKGIVCCTDFIVNLSQKNIRNYFGKVFSQKFRRFDIQIATEFALLTRGDKTPEIGLYEAYLDMLICLQYHRYFY